MFRRGERLISASAWITVALSCFLVQTTIWADDKPVVDLRGKQGVPKDLKENDPKPPRVQQSEPPPPYVKPPPPKAVGSVRG